MSCMVLLGPILCWVKGGRWGRFCCVPIDFYNALSLCLGTSSSLAKKVFDEPLAVLGEGYKRRGFCCEATRSHKVSCPSP
jgi:hypothetical protein